MKYLSIATGLAGLMLLGGMSANAKNIVRDRNSDIRRNFTELQEMRAGLMNQRQDSPKNSTKTMSRAPLQPITEVEGKEVLYNKNSTGTYGFYEEAFFYQGEFASKVVWDDSDGVYFYNILSLANYPTYVEGRKNGNEISVSLPQCVYFNSEYNYGINLAAVKIHDYIDEFGREAVEYLYDPTITSFTYTVEESGKLTMNIPGKPFDGEELPDYAIGLIYTDTKEWLGYSDFYQEMLPFEGEITRVPEGVSMREYTFVYAGHGILVEVGFDEDTLYIRGLNPNFPDGTISAKINGTSATIVQNEIMGIYENCFMYTKCVYDNPDFDYMDDESEEFLFAPEDVVYELEISDDGNTITSKDGEMYLCLNGASNRLYYLAAYRGIRLHFQESFAGTPKIPTEPYWYDEFAMGGDGTFFFNIFDVSEEGTLLKTNCLYYRIYEDGEIKTFMQEKNNNGYRPNYYYPGIAAPTTLIPYEFMNWQDIYNYADTPRRMVAFYNPAISTVGVQTVYNYEGTTSCSDILSYDIASGMSSIIPSGIKGVTMSHLLKGIYNLQGVKLMDSVTPENINSLPKGIYVIDGKKVMVK